MYRRFIGVFLLAIGFIGCGVTTVDSAEESGLRVGTFRCDVTPPLGGHPIIWVTPLSEVEDPLLAKGIVLDDGRRRYVLCAVDWCGLANSSHLLFCRKIAAAAKTDVRNVTVHCVHQHTAPYTDGDAQKLLDRTDKPPRYVDFEFLDEVTDRLAAAVSNSLENLQPFDRVGVGEAPVERVASTRRIPMVGGKVLSRMSSCTDPVLRSMTEGRIDPMLKTVTLAKGDQPLVRLHYYATHPQSFYGDPRACSDVPGFARERLEKKEGVFQIYFTGCAGDVAMGKYNDRSKQARSELTERLYAGMEASIAATRMGSANRLRWRTEPLVLPPRTDAGYTLADNRAKMEDAALDAVTRVRAATRVAFALRRETPLQLSLLQIGAVRLLHLPGEAMVEFQFFAQGLMPGDFVTTAAYGDLGPGYICTERSFSEGGYEPTASRGGPKSEWAMKTAIRKLLAVEKGREERTSPPAVKPVGLRAATFRCDVTLPLGNLLYEKPLVTVEHPLLAKGVVLDDGRRRYVLCAVDWCTMRNSPHLLFRDKIAAAAKTDMACVAVQMVHQHTAPPFDGDAQKLLAEQPNPPKYRDLQFLDQVTDRLAEAVRQSLGRLQPIDRIGTGQAKVERVASNRRILTPQGKILGRMSSCTDPKLRAEPEGLIDPILKTITLAHGEKPLVRMHYYATHPQSFYREGRASYDVPGIARERLEDKEGVFQIYFTGCAGDVAMGKYNDGSRQARDELSERLYAAMEASAGSTRLVPMGRLQWRTIGITLTARTDGPYSMAESHATLEDPEANPQDRIGAAIRIACSERLKRPIELSSLQIGDVRVLHLPGEPMIEFQRFAGQQAPDEFVAVAGYGLGTPGYICTERAFEEGGYEPSASAVIPQSETVVKEAIRGLLGLEP